MQWRVNIIACHSKLAAFQTFKVYQYETKQGNRLAAKRIIEIGLVEPDLPSHPIFHLNPTAKIHSGICSPLDFTISNLTDNSQSKDGLFSVARYFRPYNIASPTGFADAKIYVTDFGRIRLVDQKLQRVITVYQTSGQGMLDRLRRMDCYGKVMYLGGSMNIIMLALQNYTELRNFPRKDCETVIPLSSSVILAAKTHDFVLGWNICPNRHRH